MVVVQRSSNAVVGLQYLAAHQIVNVAHRQRIGIQQQDAVVLGQTNDGYFGVQRLVPFVSGNVFLIHIHLGSLPQRPAHRLEHADLVLRYGKAISDQEQPMHVVARYVILQAGAQGQSAVDVVGAGEHLVAALAVGDAGGEVAHYCRFGRPHRVAGHGDVQFLVEVRPGFFDLVAPIATSAGCCIGRYRHSSRISQTFTITKTSTRR